MIPDLVPQIGQRRKKFGRSLAGPNTFRFNAKAIHALDRQKDLTPSGVPGQGSEDRRQSYRHAGMARYIGRGNLFAFTEDNRCEPEKR